MASASSSDGPHRKADTLLQEVVRRLRVTRPEQQWDSVSALEWTLQRALTQDVVLRSAVWTAIPAEVLCSIYEYCSVFEQQLICRRVCRRWSRAVESDVRLLKRKVALGFVVTGCQVLRETQVQENRQRRLQLQKSEPKPSEESLDDQFPLRPVGRVYHYSLFLRKWTPLPSLGEARYHTGFLQHHGWIFCLAGRTEVEKSNSAECLSIADLEDFLLFVNRDRLGSFASALKHPQRGALAWKRLSPLAHRRSAPFAAGLCGRVYVFGGYDGDTVRPDAEVLDISTISSTTGGHGESLGPVGFRSRQEQDKDSALPLQAWKLFQLDPQATACEGATVTVDRNRCLLIGGCVGRETADEAGKDSVFLFDARHPTQIQGLTPLPRPRIGPAACFDQLTRTLIVLGGLELPNSTLSTTTYTTLPPPTLGLPSGDHRNSNITGSSRGSDDLTSAECLPVSGAEMHLEWEEGRKMTLGRFGFSAVCLAGTVYISRGQDRRIERSQLNKPLPAVTDPTVPATSPSRPRSPPPPSSPHRYFSPNRDSGAPLWTSLELIPTGLEGARMVGLE